ncbi:hypothetical protein [Streptomyces sp. NBC_01264]|uniref:hypothetical protein n=1 Tax=Streptomyces sp. NBC_01264 TaxID=2903804 RepID=UPI002252F971|nr:hypothetical protein [Streptomyces sp. NBC_01264]MCX4784216.1 hypothetical protein [Streptomyces sp. NBC_01264]
MAGVVYVASHGGLLATSGKTFVPAGLRVLFYAKPETRLDGLVGARVLEILHDVGQETFFGVKDGSVCVDNYTLQGFSDLDVSIRTQLAGVEAESASHAPRLYFVGGNHLPASLTQLCSAPHACRPPRHRCDGIFGTLGSFTEIRISCCRGRRGTQKSTTELSGDRDPRTLHRDYARSQAFSWLIVDVRRNAVTTDEAKLHAAKTYFDELDPKEQARVLADSPLAEIWFEIETARDHWQKEGDWGLYVYYLASTEKVRAGIRENPFLKNIIVACRDRSKALCSEEGKEWFAILPTRDQRWITKIATGSEEWARAQFASKSLNEAGVRALSDAGRLLSAYMALRKLTQRDRIIAAYCENSPEMIRLAAAGQEVQARWSDENTRDADRQAEWDLLPAEEREALIQLVPDVVADWHTREYLRGARAQFPDLWTLTAYCWLLSQPEDLQEAAAVHSDWTALMLQALDVLVRWADHERSDADRLAEWNTWPSEEREALTGLAPDAVVAWKLRVGIP